MKLPSLIFIFALFTLETFGQKAEQVMPRYYFQQGFIMNKFLINNNTPNISDTVKVDSLFIAMQKAWKSFAKDSLIDNNNNLSVQVLNNLDAYSYYLTLRSISKPNELNNDISYHLFKTYMLPSLSTDYQFIKKDPTLNNLKIIWGGSVSNTIEFGLKYYDSTYTSKTFYELFKNLKELLLSFNNSDSETKMYAARLLYFVNEDEYEIETKNYFYNNQPDLAYSYFMTGISTNKYPRYRVKPIGDIFLKYYFTKGENDKCLAILNNLIFNTTNDDLPRDTLSKWYNIVDPTNGSKIYSEALGKASNNYFRTDNNLQVNMPLKWNMILNRIPQEKIKNAKYILVDFWYSGCSPCIAEVSKLNQLNSFLKDNKNIIFISINTDSQSKKDSSYTFETSKKLSINFPVVFDNKLTDFAKQFNVTGYPTKFIINSRGQLITKENGSAMNLSTFYDFIEVNK